jgi:hypothetical protein
VSVVVLFLGFYRNQWNVADQDWFDGFEPEIYVAGRLLKSRRDGILSSGGLSGWAVPADRYYQRLKPWDLYAANIQDLQFGDFGTYNSQIGFQGILFSLFDQLTGLSPEQNLTLFRAWTSLLSALALTAVIVWFFAQFGLLVSSAVLFSTVVSQWPTVFGRNLWYSMWAFYVPMLAGMYVLAREERTGRYSNRRTAVCIFGAMFIKCLFNGYEYITTTLVAIVVPFVYYAVRDRWAIPKTVRRVLSAALGACGAVITSLVILFAQVWAVSGNPMAGIDVTWFAFAKRTYGSPSSLPPEYQGSLTANPVDVVLKYFKGTAFDLTNWIQGGSWWWQKYVLRIRFVYLVFLFLLATLLLSRWLSVAERGSPSARKGVALIRATWFSILAPLSWFVVFKAHSDLHTTINFITWHIPFTLFGFALCGLVGHRVGRLLLDLRNRGTSNQ